MIRYIFFDMGSTLIDERISDDKRIAETLTQANAPDEQTFRREMERNYRKNLDGYKQALASFRLKKLMWDCG
ncbi:MAG: HAD family hydrolase, partial [Firmicutes bacterium]|nr:HAD family hydrolase [Bacillota bacterium]